MLLDYYATHLMTPFQAGLASRQPAAYGIVPPRQCQLETEQQPRQGRRQPAILKMYRTMRHIIGHKP